MPIDLSPDGRFASAQAAILKLEELLAEVRERESGLYDELAAREDALADAEARCARLMARGLGDLHAAVQSHQETFQAIVDAKGRGALKLATAALT